jgi:fluoroacetyl-CoA thioesterase
MIHRGEFISLLMANLLYILWQCYEQLQRKDFLNMALEPGLTGEASTTVVHENTAAHVGAGGVEVFATPMMIALMENAAWRAVADSLEQGKVTVGTLVNVRHLAATPLGQKVHAIAELIEIDGRRLVFKVEAYDEKQKIGDGQHERFIVNLDQFMQRIG